MPDPVGRKAHNFDPNSFEVPEFRKNKDGSLNPTNYQAALALRDFMKRNNEMFLNVDHYMEANTKGTVTFGDRVVQLNDQEKAMFRKMQDGFFNRLDAGTNDSHDGWVGVEDINDAIRKSWKLHGTETSPKRYWKDPEESISMTQQQVKEIALQVSDKVNESGKEINRSIIDIMINMHRYDGSLIFGNRLTSADIDDPNVIQAMVLIRKDLTKIDTDKSGGISRDEIQNWKV